MKKRLEVLQEEISDCGVCCLESIIKFYGGYISLENLRMNSLTTKDGVTAYNLIECAKQYGFDSKGIAEEKIDKVQLPCIAHLKLEKTLLHFVTVYDINDKYIYIMDPACGNRKMLLDEFYKYFTGNVILLSPKDRIVKEKNVIMINTLKKYLNKHINLITKIVFIDLLFILLSITQTTFISFIQRNNSLIVVSAFIILTIMTSLVDYKLRVNNSFLSSILSNEILNDFFSHIVRLPLNYIHRKSPGEIIKRIDELESVKDIIINSIITITLNVLMIIFSVLFLFIILRNIQFIIVIVLSLVMILIIAHLNFKNLVTHVDLSLKKTTEYNITQVDMINNLVSIIHSNSEEYSSVELNNLREQHNQGIYDLNKYISKCNSIKQCLFDITYVIYNYFLVILLFNNTISLEVFVISNLLINIIINSFKDITSTIPGIILSKRVIRKIGEFYSLDEESNAGEGLTKGDIKISNLSFSYNNFNDVISNLNIHITKGEKIILKGESGKGKSTICKLLNKELVNYKGEILINNHDIKNISTDDYRKKVFYLSQNEGIFKASIKDNILLGRTISEEYFSKIYKICHLDRIDRKYFFGLDTFVKDGSYLSGGERQLVLLARSLITKPQILILDEVLSEINEELEYLIIKDIFKYYKNNTIIYISHKNTCNKLGRIIYV